MPSKQKANHINEAKANIAGVKRETLKEKTGSCNETEVNGFVVELESFRGVAEFKIRKRKVTAPFYRNTVLVNGKKVDKRANLTHIMEVGTAARLKIKPMDKAGNYQPFKILELEHKGKKPQQDLLSTSHSFSTQNNNACTTDFNQVISQHSGASWKTTASKPPFIDGAAGTVVNILSDSSGIILTDPVDDISCSKVLFEISNLFIDGEECKAKSLSFPVHLGQSAYCTAVKVNEKDGIEYKAFSVWIGRRPLLATMISCYIPKMKINNLTKGTVCCGTVKLLIPPKAALLALDKNSYAVLFLSQLCNIRSDVYGWIGDYIQVGSTLLVKISGHFHNLCFSVSEARKLNEACCTEISEMLGQTTKVSSESTISSCISLDKSLQIACMAYQDVSSCKEDRAENNKKLPSSNGTSFSFEESNVQKMKRTVFNGRTGKVVSYSSKSRGVLSDLTLGFVKFNKTAVLFPPEQGHMNLQEYLPVGTIVYYNSLFDEKEQTYTCIKLWIGKKEKQAEIQRKFPVILKSSSLLTEGQSYKAIVYQQMPYGLIVTVETFEMEVPVFVPLSVLQLYPDGPFIGKNSPSYIKCGDALFVKVYYHYEDNEKRTNWFASMAWISSSCADFEGQDDIALKTERGCTSVMSGKLALVTSDWGQITEPRKTVFFSNKNAFLFEINLSQMDLQKVLIEGETLQYIVPEDSDKTLVEASKVWYGSPDTKETLNQRIDALIGYWMKRGLDKSTLRAMIKELKIQHGEKNLLKETASNSISSGGGSNEDNLILRKETKLDIKELQRQHAEQTLQMLSKENTFNSMCSGNDNLGYDCSDRDKSKLKNEATTDIEEPKRLHAEENQQILPKENSYNSMCSGDDNLGYDCSDRDKSKLKNEATPDIEEPKRLHAEENQQILPKENSYNSMSSGDDNLSDICSDRDKSTLKNETLPHVEEPKRQHAEQNLQILSELDCMSSGGNNLSYVSTARDEVALKKEAMVDTEESQKKINAMFHSSDTRELTAEKLTVHNAESVINRLPFDLNPQFSTVSAKKQNLVSNILLNREWSTLGFENKQLSVFRNLEEKVQNRLPVLLSGGVPNSTILQLVQIWLKSVLQMYNLKEEPEAFTLLLKQMGIHFPKGQRYEQQSSVVKDKSLVHLPEEEEHEPLWKTQYMPMKKESYVAVNHRSHKEISVKSGGSKLVDAMGSHSMNQLLNNESHYVSQVPFHNSLQSETVHTNNKLAEQKKYANKEVQTISTGDILYFKVVPDM